MLALVMAPSPSSRVTETVRVAREATLVPVAKVTERMICWTASRVASALSETTSGFRERASIASSRDPLKAAATVARS